MKLLAPATVSSMSMKNYSKESPSLWLISMSMEKNFKPVPILDPNGLFTIAKQ